MVFAATGGGRAPNGAVIRMHDSLAEAAFCGTGARRRGSCSGNKRSIANKSLTARRTLGGIDADLQSARRRRAVPVERRLPHRALRQSAGLRRRLARRGRSDPARGRQVLRGGADPAQPRRRQGRLHAPRRRQRDHADRLQGRLQADGRGRLDRHLGAGRVRRPGPAGDADRRVVNEIPLLGQHGLRHVSGPDAGRDRRAARARLARAEGELSAEDGRRRMDRHHEPDRAALRHRSRPVAHQGGEAGRRQLQDHRHQDLHLGRRARPGREHRPSGAGAHRRRAGRHQGHLAVRRAEVHGQGRRLARRAQRRHLRLDRREDGHPRQFDLRDELRRRHRLAGRRGEPRPATPCSR